VSRLGPLPPLLEEDFEDEMYDEQRLSGASSSSAGTSGHSSTSNTLRSRHEVGPLSVLPSHSLLRCKEKAEMYFPYSISFGLTDRFETRQWISPGSSSYDVCKELN